jgi:hypothetical protein
MSKLLVLYVFHIYNNRVEHFIKNCIFYDENIDFIVISNDKNNTFEAPVYVKKLYRDNIGYDFGGWSDALLTNNIYKNYDNFLFVNSSSIGPFVPCNFKGKWTDIYIDELKDNIKLFGSTINTCCKPITNSHVQTYIFAMDKEALEYLIKCEIFSNTKYSETMLHCVYFREVLMSIKIVENGWNIGSLLECYKGVDFTFKNKPPQDYNIHFLDDIMYNKYRGNLWNEYDIVFVKGNRINIDPPNFNCNSQV